ncbi:hypothetical protein A2634_04535 [Candidatus Amesbacteria bacterium RIFCSPHIGHO2_01_FULL_48_32]|uniref:Thioredoxin domain-containing protein n=1 Tax=Candidatus Amesbacteria bacterium RIFCSPLOWO2_01_FULL_48_25 TaxID=1797259 RepID=A0A1F4ZCB3_9BACT|nr:MAG: hypothetical protein A2634_04535 [Candidatus Amesbacteria bacterium RIFCSPHIGHO2_01_FULL_48_32]OGD03808.1 MAG: hypothetical protein A2989_04005 [Candidatus Amesbacteria bacterium RIFCSPLOWO2_01_FULL_48_25]HJZ05083.1 thioredoxin domain-containing protein [Patescibacteria group bacterium]
MKNWLIGVLVVIGLGVGLWKMTSTKPSTQDSKLKIQDSIEITESDWVRGKREAPVTLVEYGDFQCPACGAYYQVLLQLEKEFPDRLRVVWRQFPLTTIHANAWDAAEAAEAAGRQGKFWEMHDVLFENQKEWTESGKFDGYASRIGLDVTKWKEDLGEKSIEEKVRKDQNSGIDLGVTGTPSFFLNGEKIGLPGSYEKFKAIIEGEVASLPEPETVHMHFDIAVYVDGKKLDFSADKYQEKHPAVHFHDNNGEVAHIHQKGATLGVFIDSLGLKLDLIPKVNDKLVDDWRDYVPADLDRIVFGDGVVTDKACIYSETCPERGKPPTENCVGGLGTECDDHETQ